MRVFATVIVSFLLLCGQNLLANLIVDYRVVSHTCARGGALYLDSIQTINNEPFAWELYEKNSIDAYAYGSTTPQTILFPGNGDFVLKVESNSGYKEEIVFSINSSYIPLDVSYYSYSCGTSTSLEVYPQYGIPPYTVSVSGNIGTQITSDTARFTGMKVGGHYIISVSDSCGNAAAPLPYRQTTRPLEMLEKHITLEELTPFSCDSTLLNIRFELERMTQTPYSIHLTLPDGDIISHPIKVANGKADTTIVANKLWGSYAFYVKDGCGAVSNDAYTYKDLDYSVEADWICPPVLSIVMPCGKVRVISGEDTSSWHTASSSDTIILPIQFAEQYWYEIEQYGETTSGGDLLWPELYHRVDRDADDCTYLLETEDIEMDSVGARFRISYATFEIDTGRWYPLGTRLDSLPAHEEFFVEVRICDSVRVTPFRNDFIRRQDTISDEWYSPASCGGSFKFESLDFWNEVYGQHEYPELEPDDDYIAATVGFDPVEFKVLEAPVGYNRTPRIGESASIEEFYCWSVNDVGFYTLEFIAEEGCSDSLTFQVKELAPHHEMISLYTEIECSQNTSVVIKEVHKRLGFDFHIMDITRGKKLAENDDVYHGASPDYNNIFTSRYENGDTTIIEFDNFPEGKYELIKYESCDCSSNTFRIDTFTVYPGGAPEVDIVGFICDGKMSGNFTITPRKGKQPLTYTLTEAPDTTMDFYQRPTQQTQFSDMPGGNYVFKIEDACGASGTVGFTLTEIDTEGVLDEYPASCFGAAYRAIPLILPVTDYTWYRPDSSFVSNQRILTFDYLQPEDTGLYHIHIRNDDCLDAVLDLNITVDAFPGRDTAVYLASEESKDLFDFIFGFPLQRGGEWQHEGTDNYYSDPFIFDPSYHHFGTYNYAVNVNSCPLRASVTTEAYPIPFMPQVSGCPGDVIAFEVSDPFPSVVHKWERSDGKIWYGTSMQDSAVEVSQKFIYTLTIYTPDTQNIVEPSKTVLDLSLAYAGDDDALTVYPYSGVHSLYEQLRNTSNKGYWSGPSELGDGHLGNFDSAEDVFGDYYHIVEHNGCIDSARITIVPTQDTIAPEVSGFDVNAWADVECSFTVPDWSEHFTSVSDNHRVKDTIQTPIAGTILEANNGYAVPVEISFTDYSGNDTTIKWEITVWDTVPPLVSGFDVKAFTDVDCPFTVPDWTGYFTSISDNCAIKDTIQTPAVGSILEVNNGNAVSLTITFIDHAGNDTAIQWEMAVWDTIAPLALGFDVNAYTDVECSFIVPDWTEYFTSISDNCAIKDTIQTPAAGSVLQVNNGNAVPMKISFVDYFDNATSFEWEMAVWDTIAPEITLLSDSFNYMAYDERHFVMPDFSNLVTYSDNCELQDSGQTIAPFSKVPQNQDVVAFFAQDYAPTRTLQSLNIFLNGSCPQDIDTVAIYTSNNPAAEFVIHDMKADFYQPYWEALDFEYKQHPSAGSILSVGEHEVTATVSQYGKVLFECRRTILVRTFKYPELITPNDDGLNDWFEIFFMPHFPENELRIYTTMGEEIYYKKNYGHNNDWWDGTLQNTSKKVIPGTYIFEFKAGELTHYGEITVLY